MLVNEIVGANVIELRAEIDRSMFNAILIID